VNTETARDILLNLNTDLPIRTEALEFLLDEQYDNAYLDGYTKGQKDAEDEIDST
jgi:hypothetical protein